MKRGYTEKKNYRKKGVGHEEKRVLDPNTGPFSSRNLNVMTESSRKERESRTT
jgi:hypothetical protein